MKAVVALLVALAAIVASVGIAKFVLDKDDMDAYNTRLKS